MRNKHGEERFEVIFRDGSGIKDEGVRQILVDKGRELITLVESPDMELVLHLSWTLKEKL